MELLLFFLGVLLLVIVILPIVLLVRHSALSKQCTALSKNSATLQRQLSEVTERLQSVSNRLTRLEAGSPVSGVLSPVTPVVSGDAAVAARVDVETPLPKPATRVIEPPPPTPEADLELDDLVEMVKSMYNTPPEAVASPPPPVVETAVETPPAETSPSPASVPPSATSPLDALLTPASRPATKEIRTETVSRSSRKAPLPPASWTPSEPGLLERAFAWLSGGNAVLRVGVALLFIGLAFLLRYASEQFSLPVEYRYIGVALTALILLFLGWRLRQKRPAYGLILQGAGVAVFYLTVFAAFRLHELLPSEIAFALLVLIMACSVVLAVTQDALGLASVAVLGGFAAPILISTGSNDHVALFSYFALLSAGIALVAWFKAWRVLNLIGFVSTFGIGIAWGLRSGLDANGMPLGYRPELFVSTDAFLLLFFLLYVAIGLLFTRRKLLAVAGEPEEDGRRALLSWSVRQTDYVDGSLVFGPPLIGFALQCAVIQHIEFGMAFSALALGLFYMGLAVILRGRETWRRLTLLREICLALGVVFGTLVIPLALDAEGTSAIWAVEGAGLFWLGVRQSRRLAQGFSLCLMAVAALVYLNDVEVGMETLLTAPPLGAALLGAALLFAYGALRNNLLRGGHPAEGGKLIMQSALACTGLAFVYLLPPLFFAMSMSVICWALLGLLTLFAGLFLKSRTFLISAFSVQLLGGVLFLLDLKTGTEGRVLASGWEGVLIALQVGVALLASTFFVRQETRPREHPVLATWMSVVSLTGLTFLNLTVLFVLNWVQASAIWAASGLLILWMGLFLQRRPVFYFGVLLEAVGGMAFLLNSAGLSAFPVEEGLTPLMHFDFWTPAALTLAALAGAWRIRRIAARSPGEHAKHSPISANQLGALSGTLLLWGIGWWLWTGFSELSRFVFYDDLAYAALLTLTLSALAWMWLARREAWRGLALVTCFLLPAAAVMTLLYCFDFAAAGGYVRSFYLYLYILFTPFGVTVWLLFFGVHFLTLHRLGDLLSGRVAHHLHILGCWLILGVLMLATYDGMLMLSVEENAWRWLGWALAPSLYLFWMSRERPNFWPLTAFSRAYRTHAAVPVVLGLLAWAVAANLLSDGAADPLPYLPIINPLEIGLLLVLLTAYRWSQGPFARYAGTDKPFCPVGVAQTLAGISLLALLTLDVCRSVHHWGGVAFDADRLLASMSVQACLSLVWTCYALVLMIGGHHRANRAVWMAGAALAGVVVIKLFFVELGESGGLARIISFIGVGILLLIVGYFSPLPPRAARVGQE
ncbi:MAG: DUF2339 domain-containing protein [Zoogloeaceae bacterium]|jgi:uncharacterized membrane protein|nr:DUF2339 domain-containing protein [Zoogloeaceae bacterium]